jgi:hypothetical protein
MRSLAPNAPAVQPAPSNEIETARAISEARRKRKLSARFQEICRLSREWQARPGAATCSRA